MEALPTGYPLFEPNQVLTSTQLNELRDYLDGHNRVTRARLIGTGIACGLTWDFTGTVDVAAGFGITSAGYLAELPSGSYGFIRPYIDPDQNTAGVPSYAPWVDDTAVPPGQIDLFELLTATAPGARALRPADLSDHVVVLYVEGASVELDTCLATDCDNAGSMIELTPRLLLVHRDHLDPGTPAGPRRRPSAINVARLHTRLDLASVDDADQLAAGYTEALGAAMGPLLASLEDLYGEYAQIVDVEPWPAVKPHLAAFRNEVIGSQIPAQYRYDAVKDLAAAHNELAVAACRLLEDCDVANDHPRHLLLGAADGTPGFRHPFAPSPLRTVAAGQLSGVRRLFDRVVSIARAFGGTFPRDVRLTPSHTETRPLGERALPYYYEPGSDIASSWQPREDCTVWPPWSYHDVDGEKLDTAYNAASLIRIEGHLGLPCSEVEAALAGRRERSWAEFDVVTLPLGAAPGVPDDDIAAALARAAELRAGFRRALAEIASAVPVEWDKLRTILEMRADQAAHDKVQHAIVREWAERRCARPPLCDTTSLELEYRRARDELVCCLRALAGALDDIPGLTRLLEEVPDNSDERRSRLADIRGFIAEIEPSLPFETDPAQRAELIEALETARSQRTMLELGEALVADPAWLQLVVGLGDARQAVRGLLGVLPEDLCGFNDQVYRSRWREVEKALAMISLVGHILRRSKAVGPDTAKALWARSLPDAAACLLDGCSRHALASVAATYALLVNDHRTLARFAARHPGLEHLAGVEKGGTFILVCDDDGDEARVVADFSLAGRLPCCCDRPDPCLDPTAVADHVVVELGRGDDQDGFVMGPVSIDLLDNDYHVAGGHDLRVELVADVSDAGARLEHDGSGVVRYFNERPVAGTVDHFEYELVGRRHDCRGSDRGHVLVLLSASQGPPKMELGSLSVDVVDAGTFDRVRPAEVHIDGPSGTRALEATDPNDLFVFTGLDAGQYTARALADGFRAGTGGPVAVRAGAEAAMTIELTRREVVVAPGSLVVTVVDARNNRPITFARVAVKGVSGSFVDEGPRPEGRYVFDELEPGRYAAQAIADGFQPGTGTPVEVRSGQQAEMTIRLGRPTRIGEFPTPILEHVMEVHGLDRPEALRFLAEVYGSRSQRREEIMIEARSVENTASFRAAVALMEASAPSSTLGDAEFTEITKEGIVTIARAIARNTPNQPLFQLLLVGAAGAVLDRVTMTHPRRLTPQVRQTVQVVGELAGGSGVDLAGGPLPWEPEVLEAELGIDANPIREHLG